MNLKTHYIIYGLFSFRVMIGNLHKALQIKVANSFFFFSERVILVLSEFGRVGLAQSVQLRAGRPGFDSQQDNIFLFSPQRPDRLCAQPSILSNGYWVKAAGA
jgi:hypothetical protein